MISGKVFTFPADFSYINKLNQNNILVQDIVNDQFLHLLPLLIIINKYYFHFTLRPFNICVHALRCDFIMILLFSGSQKHKQS